MDKSQNNNYDYIEDMERFYNKLFKECIKFKKEKNKKIDCFDFYNNIKDNAKFILENPTNK